MKIRNIILTGLMSIASIAPCKAQRMVQIASESGISGEINKELSYIAGLHGILSKPKNQTDVYLGMIVDAEKKVTLESQLENEYNLIGNISSWVRETFHLSKSECSLQSEVAPLKFNKTLNKTDIFAAPVYILHSDFKGKETKQGVGLVLNSTYNINNANSLKFEAEYMTEPADNLFKTHFGKLKDNISYVISLICKF